MNALWLDLRFAARTLRRTPIITIVATLTLALGMGANTAIFTVVNAQLLRPLPYPSPDRLLQVWARNTETGERGTLSPPNIRDLEAATSTLASVAMYGYAAPVLAEGDVVEPLRSLEATPSLFDVLDVRPALGRTLRPEDGVPGAPRAIVLSHALWTSRFGGDPSVLDREVRLDGEPHTIVGVMPAQFEFPDGGVQLWRALRIDYDRTSRGSAYLFGVARMREGVMLEAARADADAVATRLAREFPETNTRTGTFLVPLKEQLTAEARPVLLALMAAVTFVLLIACINVANLLVVRATGRLGEIAVRRALGAGRGRLVRQFLVEGALLATAGAGAGMLIAVWGVEALVRLAGGDVADIVIDGRVLAFTGGMLVAIALVMGLAQAGVYGRSAAADALRSSGRGGSGPARQRLRATLAAAQIALALPLLIGAALLLRTVGALAAVPAGFTAEGVITARIQLPDGRYPGPGSRLAFTERVLGRLRELPGVIAAGMTSDLPFSGSRMTSSFAIEGRPAPEGRDPIADQRLATPGYFEAMDIALVRGRPFLPTDREGTIPVAIVDDVFARRFLPDMDPLGERLILRGVPTEIVGMVEAIRHDDLSAPPEPGFYQPIAQAPSSRLFLAVRTQGDPAAFADAIRTAILEVDPLQPPAAVNTMVERMERWLAPRRVAFRLLALFASVALGLAALGLYGVVSSIAGLQQRELGIRMALGARATDVVRLVIGHGARMVGIGIGIGIVAALLVARALAGLLYGVGPADPASFAAVSALLSLVAGLACWLPARRAARTDPMRVLRHD